MAVNCAGFNSYLFRRTPDFDKELAKDRFPLSYTYAGLYPTDTWANFSGDTHTWDRVHVSMQNDDGCWEQVDVDACVTNVCDTTRQFTGWGSTRAEYGKFRREIQSPVFCFDQLRNVEEARAQLAAIIEGHKEMPNYIFSDFMRLYSLRSSDVIYSASDDNVTTTTAASMFTNNCKRLALGSSAYLPTSKLSMQYLNRWVPTLFARGYHNKQYTPDGKFTVFTDIQTQMELTNGNPALAGMYTSADFAKGGKFFQYGAMGGCGNHLFKNDAHQLRFQLVDGSGTLERIWPYENEATTIGKKPVYSQDYENAEYCMHHVYNRDTRKVFVGDTTPVSPDMPFLARNLMGKWTWKTPDYFTARDPNTGTVCTYQNDKKNKGYFLAEFEVGVKTVYPEIEQCIIAKREPQVVVDVPRCAASPAMIYQDLKPYNSFCENA